MSKKIPDVVRDAHSMNTLTVNVNELRAEGTETHIQYIPFFIHHHSTGIQPHQRQHTYHRRAIERQNGNSSHYTRKQINLVSLNRYTTDAHKRIKNCVLSGFQADQLFPIQYNDDINYLFV